MIMANVFNYLKPKADLSRNAFDLSQRHVFSAKCGQVLPVLMIDCVPGDYHDINLLSLTRTLPVKTDAFTRMKVNFDVVYVPYQQLWRDWNDFILQNQEQFSSLQVGQSLPSQVPTVALTDVLCEIVERYADFYNSSESSPAAADMMGFSEAQNALRMLDLLGYGSFYNIIDTFYQRIEYGDSIDSAIAFCSRLIVDQYGQTALHPTGNTLDVEIPAVRINLWRVLAYQKACNDYYRSNMYTPANPRLFNLDEYDLDIASSVQVSRVVNMFARIWYRLYKKDMFTALMPSPQFGDVSSVDLGTFKLFSTTPPDTNKSIFVNSASSSSLVGVQYINGQSASSSSDWTSSASIDVYQLRKAEALQKWKEDRLRAGNKNSSISEVIFGRTSRYLADKYCDFVKGFDGNMSIDEVLNTSAQGNVQLGEVGGKSVGSVSGHVSYECSEFGCLMVLYSVQPVSEYDAFGIDKNNTLAEPFDYFEPHFEHLGFDGVYGYQLSSKFYNWQNDGQYDHRRLRKTLGYAPRFLNYKTAVDKVHGEFMSLAHYLRAPGQGEANVDMSGSLSAWTTPRTDIETLTSEEGFSTEFLYVNPRVLDPIFVNQVDSSQLTDQFLVNANFVVKSVRNMSVLGLPRW